MSKLSELQFQQFQDTGGEQDTVQLKSITSEFECIDCYMTARWSWFMGQTLVLLRHGIHFTPLANVALVMHEMLQEFPNTEMFLLDLWPSYPTAIVNCNPEAGFLMAQKYDLPKTAVGAESIIPIVAKYTHSLWLAASGRLGALVLFPDSAPRL